MRIPLLLLVLVLAIGLSFGLYELSGGRFVFFGLPLVFASPFVWRGRRG
jgi:hypothetical protein